MLLIKRAVVAVVLACAPAALAAPALSTIQDTLYRADGTRFNGTVTITWNNFVTGDQSAIGAQGITAQILNGALRVQLAPTTTATPGASYSVVYNSQGRYAFGETWAVPPSTSVLRLRDVRVSTGDIVGPPPLVTTINISDVSGLTAELAVRPVEGPGYMPSRTAVINSLGSVDGASGNPSDCVRVDGTSGACGTGGSGGGPVVSFSDGEIPSGLVNGVNTSFTVMYAPAPASSLIVFRNGLRMSQAADYTLNGNTITFLTVATPQAGDLLSVSYRYADPNSSKGQMASTQVICSGSGQSTSLVTPAVLGTCVIPAGALSAGDRIEMRFDYSHQGSSTAFTALVAWGATTFLSRTAAASETIFAGRADAVGMAVGTQWSGSTWGGSLAFAASAGTALDSFVGPLTVKFSGQLNAASADSVTLRSYTVIRYPAQGN
jgi:hypothetical protein